MNIQANDLIHHTMGPTHQHTTGSSEARLKQACADFEAVFLDCMFQTMRKTLSGNDIFGKSHGRDIYESMYFQQLSIDMASQDKGLGIGDQLYQELYKKMAEGNTRPHPDRAHYGQL